MLSVFIRSLLFLQVIAVVSAEFECTRLTVDSVAVIDDRFSTNACIIINEFTVVDCNKIKDLFVDSSVTEEDPCPGYENVVPNATTINGTQIIYTQIEDAVLNCPFNPVLIEFTGVLYMSNITDFIYPKPYDLILRGVSFIETVGNTTINLQPTIVGFQNLQVLYENVSVTLENFVAEGCGTTAGIFFTEACPEYCDVDNTNYCEGSWFPRELDVTDNSICMQTSGVFNGSSSLFVLPTPTSSSTDTSSSQFQLQTFTLEAWINPQLPYAPQYTAVVGMHAYDVSSTGSVGYGFIYTKSTPQESSSKCTSIGFTVTVDGASTNDLICKTRVGQNEWVHLTGTYSPTNGMKFYINGILACTLSTTRRAPDYDTVRPFRIGAGVTGSKLKYFTGQIDEVRLWNFERTASQIAVAYAQPITTPVVGLILHYPFNIDDALPFINVSPFTTTPTWTNVDDVGNSNRSLTLVYDCMCVTLDASCVPSTLYFEEPPTAVDSILSTESISDYEFIHGAVIDPNGNYGILWLPGVTVTTGPFYNLTTTFIPGRYENVTQVPCTGNSTEAVTTTIFVPGANPVNLPPIGGNPWNDGLHDFFMPGWFISSAPYDGAFTASNFFPGVFNYVNDSPPNLIGQLLGCFGNCSKTFIPGIRHPDGSFEEFPLLSQYNLLPTMLGGFCWNDTMPDNCTIPPLEVVTVPTVPELEDNFNCSVSDLDVEPTYLDPMNREPCFAIREIRMAMEDADMDIVNGTNCDLSGGFARPSFLNPLERDPCSIIRALMSFVDVVVKLNCSNGEVPHPAINMPCLRNQNLTLLDMVIQTYYGEKVVCMHSCDEFSSAVVIDSQFARIPGSALWLSGLENYDVHGNIFCPCGGMTEACVYLNGNEISVGEYFIYNNRHCAIEDLLPHTCSYPLTQTVYCEAGVLLCLDIPATLDINCQQVQVADGVYYFDTACAVYSPCQCGSEDQVIDLPDGTSVIVTETTGTLIIDIAYLTPLISDITNGEASMNVSCSTTTEMRLFNYSCTVYNIVEVTVGNVTMFINVSSVEICTILLPVQVGTAESLLCMCPSGFNASFSTTLTGSEAAGAVGLYSTCLWELPDGLPGETCLNGVVQCPYAGGTLGSGTPPPVPVGACAPNMTAVLDCNDCVSNQQYFETGYVTCPGSCATSQYFVVPCQCANFSLLVTCVRDVSCVPPVPCLSISNNSLCGYTGTLTYDGGSYPCFVEENATLCTGYSYVGGRPAPADGYMLMPCDDSYVAPSPGPCTCSSIITTSENITVSCTNTTNNATCNGDTPTSVQTGYAALQLTCNTDGSISCRCDGAQAVNAPSYNGSRVRNDSAAYFIDHVSINATWYQQINVAQQLPYGWRYVRFVYDLIKNFPLVVLSWFSDKAVLYESSRLSPLITGTVADWVHGYDDQWNVRYCNMLDPGPLDGVYDNECKPYRPSENTSCVVDYTYEDRVTTNFGVTRFNRIKDALDSGCNNIIIHKSVNAYNERMRITRSNVWIGSYDGAVIIAAGHGVYADRITFRGLRLQHTNAISFPLIASVSPSGNPFDTDFSDVPDDTGTPDYIWILNCELDGANVDKAGALIGLFGKRFMMNYNSIYNFHTRAVHIQGADVEIRLNTFLECHGWQIHLIEGYAFTVEENLFINGKGKRKVKNLELLTFKCQGDYGPIVKNDIGTLDFAQYTQDDYINLFNIEAALELIDGTDLGCNPSDNEAAQCYVRGNHLVYPDEENADQLSTVGFRFIGGNITTDRIVDNIITHGQIGMDFSYTVSINFLQADVLSATNPLIRTQDSFSMKGKTGADWCFRPPGSLSTVCCYYPNCWPNSTFPTIEVNPRCEHKVSKYYGFNCMQNITDAARWNFPMDMLNVTSGVARLRNEIINLKRDVYAQGLSDAYCCARPVIYGAKHQLGTSQIILDYLEFRMKLNITDNQDISVKMFETPTGFLADDIQFWDVYFDGRQVLGNGKVRIASIHISPSTGIFALRNSRIYNWWSLPDDARRGILASAKGSAPIYVFDAGTEFFYKVKAPSIDGFYIYFQKTESLDASPYVQGSKSNPQLVFESQAIIKDNIFWNLDGNVLTLAQAGNWDITDNQILDCGVRQPRATACFFLNGHMLSTGDYFFENNYFNTTKYYLAPFGGGQGNPVYFSAISIGSLLFPRVFIFRNNTVVKNGNTTQYPLIDETISENHIEKGLDWGWFNTAGPRILNAPWQITQTPKPNTLTANDVFDRDTNPNHIITGGNANIATLTGDDEASDNSGSYGDPMQALLSINAEGKIYTYPIEDETRGYPYAVRFNLPPQILVKTLNPDISNMTYFASIDDQLYPLRVIEVENGVDAMKMLAFGNISKAPSNGPGLRGITGDLILCEGYKDMLQSSFQQCTICNNGCPIPVPTECRVDPKNGSFVPENPYYGSWLFLDLQTALLQCVNVRRKIVVVRQALPYTEPWHLNVANWTIASYDRAEVFVSTPVVISASGVHVEGFKFIHAAGIYSPTMTSTALPSGGLPSDITVKNCIFNGTGIKQSALLGSYESLALLNNKFVRYLSQSASVVDIHSSCGMLFMQNNSFVDARYSAVTASNYDSYTLHNNKFKHCGGLATNARPYCVYVSACQNTSTRIHFTNNKHHEVDYTYMAGHSRVAAFWLDTLPLLHRAKTGLPHIDLSFNVANDLDGLDIGMRVTNVEDIASNNWVRNRDVVQFLSSGSKNHDVKGSWHYIVWGEPNDDAAIEADPEATQHFWCDNDCSASKAFFYQVVILSSIVGFFVVVSALICVFCLDSPAQRMFVDGVWISTTYTNDYTWHTPMGWGQE